ncbi:MAG: right-handed parallel beta-helix repeat-containing protein [Candidatus Heimdallarchaeota archaeon]|nr:right-handed parallel beta-helix repeat-containing protein [Candidatus Heimdallarchaeota archaeon]
MGRSQFPKSILIIVILILSVNNTSTEGSNPQITTFIQQSDDFEYQNFQISEKNFETIKQPSSSLVASDPIIINGDSDFNLQASSNNWNGNGSESNPYIIENLNISSDSHAISISNTNVHFILRGSTLDGGSLSGHSGLYLSNVVNGIISNNMAVNSNYGFRVMQSSNLLIEYNIASENGNNGFYFSVPYDINITKNIAYNNEYAGFSFSGYSTLSKYINVINNIAYNQTSNVGIRISSRYVNLVNNTVFGNSAGISLNDDLQGDNFVINNYIFSNDKGIAFYSAGNNTIEFNEIYENKYGIWASNSENMIIRKNIVFENTYGLYLYFASNNQVLENNIYDNSNGIYIVSESQYISIMSNNITNNDFKGIYVSDSADIIISNNIIRDNEREGLYLHSTSTSLFNHNFTIFNNGFYFNGLYGVYQFRGSEIKILNNSFVYNNQLSSQAFYELGGYSIDQSNIYNYNYWSDYPGQDANNDGIGDIAYQIFGDGLCEDKNPVIVPHHQVDLTIPEVEIITPTNNGLYNSLTIEYYISEKSNVIVLIDGISNATSVENGTQILNLEEGDHNISILAQDDFGNIGLAQANFTIDTLAPSISITSPKDQSYSTSSVTVSYQISDEHAYTTTIYLDSMKNTSTIESGFIWTDLTEGQHNLTIISVDEIGNMARNSILFTIDSEELTSTTESTTIADISTSTSESTDQTPSTKSQTSTSSDSSALGILSILCLIAIAPIKRKNKILES